jgi:hypothetical protein
MADKTESLIDKIQFPDFYNDWEDDNIVGCTDVQEFEFNEVMIRRANYFASVLAVLRLIC